MQKCKGILIIAICLLLSGCGFHLRKNAEHLNTQYPVIILPFSGSHTFHQALTRTLLAHSIRLVECSEEDFPRLNVVAQTLSVQPLVYGPDSELRRERLFMSVTFSFGCECLKEFTLSTVRDHQLYSSQHLGDNAEKSLMEAEMQMDIIEQLLRYIQSEHFT